MSLRKNLEYLRKQKKLSQEELAYKLGVSRQAVSKWESGAAYPETEKILAICKIFDCSLDELMNEDIQQLELDKDRRYTFNDLVNEITDIVTRTLDMFDNMTFKSILRFGFEMFILFLIILLTIIQTMEQHMQMINIYIKKLIYLFKIKYQLFNRNIFN